MQKLEVQPWCAKRVVSKASVHDASRNTHALIVGSKQVTQNSKAVKGEIQNIKNIKKNFFASVAYKIKKTKYAHCTYSFGRVRKSANASAISCSFFSTTNVCVTLEKMSGYFHAHSRDFQTI